MKVYKFDKDAIEQLLKDFRDKLDFHERMIIWWKICDEKSFEDIAKILRITKQRVHQKYNQAIKKI